MEPPDATTSPNTHPQPVNEVLDEKQVQGVLDWKVLFGRDALVEMEVGCGNGRFLRRAASERPEHLFFAIERSAKYAGLARDRLMKHGIANARVCRADATSFLAAHVAPASIEALHIYFTDPWPKTRHAKRRIFQTPFLETIHRVLRPNGHLHIKVDLFWYFEEIFGRFERSPHFRVVANGTEAGRERDMTETTGFEDKALRKKGVVYWLEVENLGSLLS